MTNLARNIHLSIGLLMIGLLILEFSQPNRHPFIQRIMEGINQETNSCQPHHHIMFLKTHKCGSTTMQNMLFRYGYKNNLTFTLPTNSVAFVQTRLFQSRDVATSLLDQNGKNDIFALHTRQNVKELSKVLYPDSKWITILREPASLYESILGYGYDRKYNLTLDDYKTKDIKYLRSLPHVPMGKNQMLYDLGYSEDLMEHEVETPIKEVENQYDLVMIMEYFDESLILLRHLLCWSLEDVAYFKQNSRTASAKTNNTDAEIVNKLRELNSADVVLYNYFLEKHKKAIIKFGVAKMETEVAALRELNIVLSEECDIQEVNGVDKRLEAKQITSRVNAYLVGVNSREECKLMTLIHRPFKRLLRHRQKEILNSRLYE